ncbi:amino acid ABC transporter permease [Azospirillum sp.]|uniref:amino acid ABC transporter permease n=1 Tax=Azospirillum sp. TaxID=34012 RepID=UPI0026271E99|nr:amino acid ABC transporter permease [Azospirillum sp.]
MTVTTALKGASPARLGLWRHPALRWAWDNLFGTPFNGALSVVLLLLIGRLVVGFIDWGLVNAVWTTASGDSEACRAAAGSGACWAFITEKHRFILFGLYPHDQHWRPATVVALFVTLYALSARRGLWNARLLWIWLVGLTLIALLMWGGLFGLPYVENERWGGLPITLMLATFGIVFAFPLSILLALGRQSTRMPGVKALCVGVIELIRGVPLVSLLFMGSFLFPLFLPEGVSVDKLLRAQVAITLFASAYLAEVVRAGMQAIPKGQYEAADALGLSYAKKMRLIVLPQALRLVIPPLVNTFIGLFKDTSLVVVIGLYDLLSAVKTALQEPIWRGFGTEAYLFVSLIYFGFCFAMSRYSKHIERRFAARRNR